jgi:hypothetical protein
MSNLRRLFFQLFVWFTSISIVVGSIVFVLPDGELHKQRLRENNFYELANTALKPQLSLDKYTIQNSFSYILSNTIITEVATPSWIRGVVERNIDITTSWLAGKENWELYVPTREIEQSIQKSIDTQTQTFVDENKKELKVCTDDQSLNIKANGFDLSKDFCIPSEVRNGQQKLTEFVATDSLGTSVGILNKLIKNSTLSKSSEIQNISELTTGVGDPKNNIISFATNLRDVSLSLRSNIFALIMIVLGLWIANIWFLYATRRSVIYFIFKSAFSIGTLTAIFSAIFILFVGGASYATQILREFLLPGFINTNVLKLINQQLVVFGLDLVTPALFISFGFIILGFVTWTLKRFDILVPAKFKDNSNNFSNNQTYKDFFASSGSNKSDNQYEKKLELLKTYNPSNNIHQEDKVNRLTLPAPKPNASFPPVITLNKVVNIQTPKKDSSNSNENNVSSRKVQL